MKITAFFLFVVISMFSCKAGKSLPGAEDCTTCPKPGKTFQGKQKKQ